MNDKVKQISEILREIQSIEFFKEYINKLHTKNELCLKIELSYFSYNSLTNISNNFLNFNLNENDLNYINEKLFELIKTKINLINELTK